MQYQKTLNNVNPSILLKVEQNLRTKGFKIKNKGNNSLEASRGSEFAQLYSFDIRKYKTVLNVTLDTKANSFTFSYEIKMGGAIPTSDDQQKLDQEIQEILGNESGIVQASPSGQLTNAAFDLSKMYAIGGLLLGFISLFIIRYLAIGGASLGAVGVYLTIKNKSSWKIILLNVGAIVLGIFSFVLSEILVHQ